MANFNFICCIFTSFQKNYTRC